MLNALIAGTAGGMLMASVFITTTMLMLFFLLKAPTPRWRAIFARYRPATLAMAIVALAYPVWGIVGAVLGVLYIISVRQAPGGGLGSPNLVFTLAVVVATAILAAPFLVLLRQVVAGVVALALVCMGIFGWFLPYFSE